MPEIHNWQGIAERYTGESAALILGNGASIAVDPRFDYASLLKEAQKNDFISENLKKIFHHLRTKDFELVLRMLWHSSRINKSLSINENKTLQAYRDLRNALINIIRQIHPAREDVSDRLLNIAEFMKQFATIISLNYDFIVYWTMLMANDEWNITWFKDCFISGSFDYDWQRYREPLGGAEGASLVFYPHGNLSLAIDKYGEEIKLARDEDESPNLLKTIFNKWKSDKYIPLFVSEGTSKQKLRAIHRSNYLDTVYKSILPKLGSKLVVFGWSISENDDHILKAIGKGNLIEVAVSVCTSHPGLASRCEEMKAKLRAAANNEHLNVIFFDANSARCWANGTVS